MTEEKLQSGPALEARLGSVEALLLVWVSIWKGFRLSEKVAKLAAFSSRAEPDLT